MGEVPVLEHGDLRLSQSGMILDYLSHRFTALRPQVRGGAPRGPALDALGQPQAHQRYVATAALPDEVRPRGKDATRASSPGSASARAPRSPFSTATSSPTSGSRPTRHHRRPLLRRLPLLRPRVRPRPDRLSQHRALAPRDRSAPRLEASLRPDAGPPDPRPACSCMTDAYIYDAIRTPRGRAAPTAACTR